MATDITLDSLTNTTSVNMGAANGTGVLDKLMNTVNLYLKDQYDSNRLKGTDYANVLVGSIQSVIAQSVQYTMQEQLLEAQVDGVRADNELKAKQLEIAEIERLSKLYEKDTLLVDQHNQTVAQISLTGKQEDQIDEQILVTKQEVLKATYEVSTLLPDQHSTNLKQLDLSDKEIEVKERSMLEQEATGVKQRTLLDKDIAIKEYESTVLQIDQHAINVKQQDQLSAQIVEVLDSTIRSNTQLNDQLLTSDKQRDNLIKDLEVKAQQISNMQTDTEFKEREVIQSELTSEKQRLNLVQDVENKIAQKALLEQQKFTEVQTTAKGALEISELIPEQINKSKAEAITADLTALMTKVKVEEDYGVTVVASGIKATSSDDINNEGVIERQIKLEEEKIRLSKNPNLMR